MKRFSVERALGRLSTRNSWRLLHYVLYAISFNVSGAWHMMVAVFTGGVPEHHCRLPVNITIEDAIPADENDKLSECSVYVNYTATTNTTEACTDGWTYDTQIGTTIVTQWNLVCDKNYYAETTQSVFVAGVLVGALIFPTLGDKVGRKPVHFACQYAMIVIGALVALMPTWEAMTALKFFNGAVREGAGLMGIVLTCELWQSSLRPVPGIGIQLFWIVAWVLLALLAYLIRNWHYLQLVISLTSVFTIPLYWIVPESLFWLVANGRGEEAAVHLKTAASWEGNPTACDDILIDSMNRAEEERLADDNAEVIPHTVLARVRSLSIKTTDTHVEDVGPQYTLLDIRRSMKLVLYTTVMCLLWFVNTLVYHGLSMLSSHLAGDRYVNFFLSGIVELPAYVLCIFVLQKYGRRLPLCFHHVLTGVVLLLATCIPHRTKSGVDLSSLITALALVGKYGISFSFAEVVLYCQEIYPTNLRGAGMGLASFFGRIANMIAPFSTLFVRMVPWLPGVVFGILSILVGFLALLLPETMGRPLPLTIEEVHGWSIIPKKPQRPTPNQTNSTSV